MLAIYHERLLKALKAIGNPYDADYEKILAYLNTIPASKKHPERGYSTRHSSFRTMRTFFKWLEAVYQVPYPMKHIPAPDINNEVILPTLNLEEVQKIMGIADSLEKALVSLFVDSGLRVNEMANVKIEHINWNIDGQKDIHGIRITGKGNKQRFAPITEISESYVRSWITELGRNTGSLFGLTRDGIRSRLRRLKEQTGLVCNPHVFRRTFAYIKKQQGLDIEVIRILGGWADLEMPQRYTKMFGYTDAIKVMRKVTNPKPLMEMVI